MIEHSIFMREMVRYHRYLVLQCNRATITPNVDSKLGYAVSPGLLPWAQVVMHACITWDLPDGAAPFHSTAWFKLWLVSKTDTEILCIEWVILEKRVKHASPRSRGRPKGQVATRSFSLPWLRLVHILLQSSAPIHPLDQGFSILITWSIKI